MALPEHRRRSAPEPRIHYYRPSPKPGLHGRGDGPAWPHPESVDTEGSGEALDQLARFWDLINLQDIEIVERVQEGLSNPAYRGGRMCYRFEEPLHRFQNMVIDKMVGIKRTPPG